LSRRSTAAERTPSDAIPSHGHPVSNHRSHALPGWVCPLSCVLATRHPHQRDPWIACLALHHSADGARPVLLAPSHDAALWRLAKAGDVVAASGWRPSASRWTRLSLIAAFAHALRLRGTARPPTPE